MKTLWLAGTCLATLLAGPLDPSNALASGVETNKFVKELQITSGGAIGFTVVNPGDSASCTNQQMVVNAQKDRMYSRLLAAKTATRPIRVEFDNDCKVTSIDEPPTP